jgi:hypothetical protein
MYNTCMSKKEMEKNLSYGDCFNFFGALFGDLLGINSDLEKEETKNKKDK